MLKKYQEFIPKAYFFLRKYNRQLFKKDLIAGITVGIVAFPLAMAFAMASGIEPDRGLYTAIIGGFLVSLLGGCRAQIAGPTGAFVIVVYSVVQRHGYDGLVLATFFAALILIAMGLLRLGSLIKFIPYPLITGFTSGIAVLIFSSQIKDFFGLKIGDVPADFIEKWSAHFQAASMFDPITCFFALGTLLFIVALRRFFPRAPWALWGIVLASIAAWAFSLPLETIDTRFGEIPRTLPLPNFNLNFAKWREVFPDAITIALLAGIESLLSAVIADSMMGSSHKSNCELVAQGIANVGSIAFGGIPVTAALARTATNIKMGAQTPVAGIIHAATLFIIMLLFAPLAGHIPLAALAAILVMVAWNMSEAHHFFLLLRAPKGDLIILLAAFFLTIFVDLTVAVEVGMILAAFFFMKRMSDVKQVIVPKEKNREEGIEIYEMQGPFFFGVANRLKDLFQSLEAPPKLFILRMKHVPVLDATALHALRELNSRCEREKTRLVLQEVQPEPAQLLKEFGLEKLIS